MSLKPAKDYPIEKAINDNDSYEKPIPPITELQKEQIRYWKGYVQNMKLIVCTQVAMLVFQTIIFLIIISSYLK